MAGSNVAYTELARSNRFTGINAGSGSSAHVVRVDAGDYVVSMRYENSGDAEFTNSAWTADQTVTVT